MGAVYRKEIRGYRTTMPAYIFVAFILAVTGLYFSFLNLNIASPKFETVLQNIQFVYLVFVPMLTMRVLAEEHRQKTDQLLLTLPLKESEIILGKYLALVTVFGSAMLVVCFYPLILTRYGKINLATAYLSILGFFFLGCAELAIGLFFSSVTESPVISAVLCFVFLLVCYLMNSISRLVPGTAFASLVCFLALVLLLA
ncbi:MAG: ABC-2 transporter permease, partial [Blautia sp.]|nr:ABC-2 transporter permease [Blautia sp.]